jgi:hypothetical protein
MGVVDRTATTRLAPLNHFAPDTVRDPAIEEIAFIIARWGEA